jgi:hypothetical protein
MGVEVLAERAARELRATGATARKRRVEPGGDLTRQETQIARQPAHHLRKAFTKLRISSRKDLGSCALINQAGSPFDAPDTTSNAGEPAVGTRAAVLSVDRGQSTIRPILSDVGEPCLGNQSDRR